MRRLAPVVVRHLPRTLALGLGLLLAAVLAPGTPTNPPVTLSAMTASAGVTFTGHGYGHGRGMGQYGAYGYARSGWSYQQILAHYYGKTVLTQVGNPLMTVRLVNEDNRSVDVFSDRGMFAGGLWIAAGDAAHITAKPGGGATVAVTAGCGGRTYWVRETAGTRADPPVDGVNRDRAENLRLCSTGARYRGSLVSVNDNNALRTVSALSMEEYLRGVVPQESPASWADQGGAAALSAQAVAARSYSLSEARYAYAKTCDTQSCQVYGGSGGEDRRSDAAIAASSGVVLTRDGRAVRAEYSSSTGGHTAGGTFPAVVDDGDTVSPYHGWSTTVSAGDIGAAFGVGELIAVQVTARNGLGADGGRAVQVTISGTRRTVTVSGTAVQAALGLRSDWFSTGFAVYGAIGAHYTELGGAGGFLGAASTDELGTPNGKARYNHFQGGSIYWSPPTGAHEVHGAIRQLWSKLGWEAGLLGLPVTDETRTPNGRGAYNHFQYGSVYWSPPTGAHEVHGAIRDTWAGSGWEAGPLGFPTSDEHDVPGGRASTFQGGTLTFSFTTGRVVRS